MKDLKKLKIELQLFGGRGAGSTSGGGGGGGTASGELELPSGSKIEFDGELHFDGDDKALTGTARKAIVGWEEKRANMKVEYAFATDKDGNSLGSEMRGGKGSVRVPYHYHDTPDGAFTHIHPRGDGLMGGTFSGTDLRNFSRTSGKTVRAVAKEGTYSISKGKNFDSAGFESFVRKAQSDCHNKYGSSINKLNAKAKNGGFSSYDDYKREGAKAFNTYLVDLHEAYRSGQKKYGYTYTLEKRS